MNSSKKPPYISSLSDEDVAQAEQIIGDIPLDLLALYRKRNGGMPEHGIFVNEEGDDYTLDYIFPIPETNLEPVGRNIVAINTRLKKERLVPDDHLVFGSDPGSNYFSVAQKNGSVWYHPMDVWEEDCSPEENQTSSMERLSGSVSAFFGGLSDD